MVSHLVRVRLGFGGISTYEIFFKMEHFFCRLVYILNILIDMYFNVFLKTILDLSERKTNC